ncbi:hypothetical protein [Salinarimonas soli]|uniref:Uncharacterized protein n=1 Tax=Salinarimonas soli TaxID=1638099 RepID=A0A5B2VEK6_9HYPH|nr:hypothetical protein [Salinarimonas soli]KAA2237046.1 hypothetical protein F0L46_12330 [Salinarimonas soli]
MPLLALLLTLASTAALAQEQGAPLVFDVTPSGIDDGGAAARDRLERLVRRREQADYRFRTICINCGGQDRWGAGTYSPFQALGGRGAVAD